MGQVKTRQLSTGVNVDIVVGDWRFILFAQCFQQRFQFVILQSVPVRVEEQVVVPQKRISGIQFFQLFAERLNESGGRERVDDKGLPCVILNAAFCAQLQDSVRRNLIWLAHGNFRHKPLKGFSVHRGNLYTGFSVRGLKVRFIPQEQRSVAAAVHRFQYVFSIYLIRAGVSGHSAFPPIP